MAKRGGSELTHDNWDQEDEREDAGTFKKATEGDMKSRVIKRARRRNDKFWTSGVHEMND